MDSSSHYFSQQPPTDEVRRDVEVELAGRLVRVETSSGVFSVEGLDRGTAALLQAVAPLPATGRFLDIGSGWGPIALSMALESPDAEVVAVEVNERARALTTDNATRLGLNNITVCAPDDVAEQTGFDVIWSNPPIRVGKKALHEILSRWLPALNPGGEAWLVVAKKLGADSLLPWIQNMLNQHSPGEFDAVRTDTIKGFRILRISRATAA